MDLIDRLTHVVQGRFIGPGQLCQTTIPQCQWCNPEEYGKNQTVPNHNKAEQSVNRVHCSWAYSRYWVLTHWPLMGISCEIALRSMSVDPSGFKSTFAAPSHCANQCWHNPMSPYGVTRPQCTNTTKGTNYGGAFTLNPIMLLLITLSNLAYGCPGRVPEARAWY